jgi:hypothetical protein
MNDFTTLEQVAKELLAKTIDSHIDSLKSYIEMHSFIKADGYENDIARLKESIAQWEQRKEEIK